jgi:hypothetical protein
VDDQITAIYSLCDDVLKTLPHVCCAAHQRKKLRTRCLTTRLTQQYSSCRRKRVFIFPVLADAPLI